LPESSDPDSELLAEVDFKWLMAGQGLWIDPTRLHNDPSYATVMLSCALDSPLAAIRDSAAVLQAHFLHATATNTHS
jgi:hypothetical protein